MGVEDDESSRTLYCGNLHEKVTEELLYELFVQAGPLEKVKVVPGKNFSFITFQHEISVPYTIQLMSGVKLFGRNLKLQFRNRPDPSMDNSGHYQRSMSAPDIGQYDFPGGDSQRHRRGDQYRGARQSYPDPTSRGDSDMRQDRGQRSRRDADYRQPDSDYRHQAALQQSIQSQLANARLLQDQQQQFLQAQQLMGLALQQGQPWQPPPPPHRHHHHQQHQHQQQGRRWNRH